MKVYPFYDNLPVNCELLPSAQLTGGLSVYYNYNYVNVFKHRALLN